MKNKLLKLMLLLCALIVGVSSSWADETYTLTISGSDFNTTSYAANNNEKTSNAVCTTDNTKTYEVKWTSNQVMKSGNNMQWQKSKGYIYNSTDLGTINSVTVNSTAGSFTTYYGTEEQPASGTAGSGKGFFKTSVGSATGTTSSIVISFTISSGGEELENSDLALTGAPIALNFDLYNNSDAQVINYTTTSTGAVSIDESDYATFAIDDENGTITVTPKTNVTPSAQTITVNQAADETYKAGSVTFTVTITDSTPIPTYTVTLGDDSSELTEESAGAGVTLPTRNTLNGYTFAGWSETNVSSETTAAPTIIPAGDYEPTANITLYPVYTKVVGGGGTSHESTSVTISDYASTNKWSSGTKYTSVTLDENITATASGSTNTGKYYTTGNSWRIYSSESGKLILNASNGAELTSATISFSNSTLSYGGNNITSGSEVSLSGTSAEFSAGGTTYITAISVNYDIAGGGTTYYWSAPVAAAVEMPSIVVAENPFLFSTTATITCATDGAAIKYSYDGENWNDYTEALTITETKTIYAKAVKSEDESSVAQVTATKNLAEPTVAVSGDLTLDLDGETNVEAGTLTAAVTYNEEAVEGAAVTWTSSNETIATIDAETGAVTIKTTGTVTFTATYAGNSDYAEATGTKTVTVIDSKVPGSVGNPYTVAQARAAIDAGTGITDVYATGKISQIDSYNSTYHSITYWISADGNTTGDQLEVYSGKGLDNANFSAVTDLQVGDVVVVYGTLKKYNEIYEFDKNNYIVSRTELPASDLTKTEDIVLDYKNGATEADLTDYFTTSSAGAITYTVADETVIENADELISALKVGTTTVTVSQAATLSYKAGEITINVTVQDTRDAATTIPAINIETLKVNDAGTLSVTDPVKADEGVTFSFASSDDEVLFINGTEYTALTVGTATVTVTATPSNTNLYKPVVANFEVTVEADVKTDTEIALDVNSGSTVYGTQKSVEFLITDGYDGEMNYIISNPAIADVEIGASAITFTPKAVGTATITISAPATATFNAAENVQYTLTVTAPEGVSTAAVLGEETYTFDLSDNSDWEFPTDYATGENTYTKDGKTITLYAASNGYKHLGSALLIGKSGSTLTLPAFDRPVTKISTTGVTGASGKVTQNIFVGETAVSTATTSAAVDHEYEIASEYQAAGTIYTLKVTNANNTQLSDITVHMQGGIAVKLNAAGYATYCSQYPLDFSAAEGYTAWQIKAINGEEITFEKVTGAVKGGTGLLLKGEAGATVTLASADSDAELAENLLFGTTAPTYVSADTYYGLSGDMFKKVNAGTVPAGKALLPASAVSAEVKAFTFVFEDNETGLTEVQDSRFKVQGSEIFNLAGQRVSKAQKGIYIVNGKKVLIK